MERAKGHLRVLPLRKHFCFSFSPFVYIYRLSCKFVFCRYNRLSRLREKSDVFSFGVVLLEIITGQPAITKTENKIHIVQLVSDMLLEREVKDIVDPRLQGDFDINYATKALDTAMACVAQSSINRPTMRHVVMELKQCLENKITYPSESKCTYESFPSALYSVSFDRISGESSLAR